MRLDRNWIEVLNEVSGPYVCVEGKKVKLNKTNKQTKRVRPMLPDNCASTFFNTDKYSANEREAPSWTQAIGCLCPGQLPTAPPVKHTCSCALTCMHAMCPGRACDPLMCSAFPYRNV